MEKPLVGAKKLKQLIHDKLLHVVMWDATDIRVKVSKGVVTLMGTVADHDDLQKAEDLIKEIHGVTAVNNTLKIKRPGIAAVLSEIASKITHVMTDDEYEHDKKHHPDSPEKK